MASERPPVKRRSKSGLRPCPFCGSVRLSAVTVTKDRLFLCIQCDDCGATGPVGARGEGLIPDAVSEEEQRRRWDTRSEGT